MTTPQLADAFAHHIWASVRLLEACAELGEEALTAPAEGIYGPILDTLRHLVDADAWYLASVTGDASWLVEEASLERMGPGELRAIMERDGGAWVEVLARSIDPEVPVREIEAEDAGVLEAPLGIWLAQAVHHGTDHRSQVCTALTLLGVEPPAIDVWDFGEQDGRVVETEQA